MIIDDNDRIDKSLKLKLKQEQKSKEDAFLSEFLKRNRHDSQKNSLSPTYKSSKKIFGARNKSM